MKFSVIITFALIGLTAAQDNFRAKNADDAEKLTEDFKKLTPDSPCKDGDQACVNDQFAQCVGGKFALTPCGGGDLKCVVLPLVNKAGTSITCSTEQDRLNRLAEARGQTPPEQPKGKGKDNAETPDPNQPKEQQPKGKGKDNVETPDPNQPKEQPPKGKGKDNVETPDPNQPKEQPPKGKGNDNTKQPEDFRAKNADDAEKLTEDFKKLTPDSPCNDGDQACVNDQFAQCVGGKFALTPCGGGDLKCVVLPLVNKAGTSITCSTEQDRLNRLAEARGQTPPSSQPEQPKGKGKDNVETPDPNQPPKEQPPPKGKGKDKEQPPNQPNQPQPQQPQPPKNPENPKGKGSLAEIRSKNADEAEKLQEQFKSFTPDQACKDNEIACVNDELAQCVNNKFSLTKCGDGLKCSVLPLVLKEGTTVACTTEADRLARLDEARKNLK